MRQEQGKVKVRGKIAAEQVRCFPISCVLLVNLFFPLFYLHYCMTVMTSYLLVFLSDSFVVLHNFCVFRFPYTVFSFFFHFFLTIF